MLISVLFVMDRCNVNKSHLREPNGSIISNHNSGLLPVLDKQSKAVLVFVLFFCFCCVHLI